MKPQMWIWRQVWTCSHSKKRSMSLPSMVSLWATWRLRPPLGLALPLPHTPGQCCFSPAKLTRSMKPQLQLWSLELLSLLQRGELEATSLLAIPEVASTKCRMAYNILELKQILPEETLPSHKITLAEQQGI